MILRTLPWLIIFLFAGTAPAATHPKAKPKVGPSFVRLEKALRLFESRDEEANVQLTIVDGDGSKSSREISIVRARNRKEQRMIARILAPSDLKGTSLLSVISKKSENQWVYLPSTKQTRKILTSDQPDAGILGSELRYEDFNPSVIRRTRVSFLKTETRDGKTFDIFETKVPAGLSVYSSAQIWIDTSLNVPTFIHYFAKTEMVKTIEFKDYRKIGKHLRPHSLQISNLVNKRGTEIKLTKYRINKGLLVQNLSVESLSKNW